MNALTPWTQRLLDDLADGNWHPREHLLASAAPLVPSGIAHRAGEANRLRKHAGPRRTGNENTAVAAGARQTVRRALNNLIANGTCERHLDRIRLRP